MVDVSQWVRDFFFPAIERLIPYRNHLYPGNVVANRDNQMMAMMHAHGQPFELLDPELRNANSERIHTMLRSLANQDVTLCFNMVHHRKVPAAPQPASDNHFVRKMMENYNAIALKGMFRNDWFISPIVHPPESPRQWLANQTGFRKNPDKAPVNPTQHQLNTLEHIVYELMTSLSEHKISRLGLRDIPSEYDGLNIPITEIGTALRMIRSCDSTPVPHTWGSLGAAIYDEPVVFHHEYFDTKIETSPDPFGAIISYGNYPIEPRVGMLNTFMSTDYPVVVSHSMRYRSVGAVRLALTLVKNRMENAASWGKTMMQGIADEGDKIESMLSAPVCHSFRIAVYAPTPQDLERCVADAKHRMTSHTGATPWRERNILGDGAMPTSYFAQLPGFQGLMPNPADGINTEDIASMVGLENFPTGSDGGYWGPSPVRFRTTARTAYDYITHNEDVGHWLCIGPNGRGKTTFAGFLTAAMDPIMGADGIRFIIDKDDSNRQLVQACGGTHQRIRRGEASGVAPLLAFPDTPRTRAFFRDLYKWLIERDDRGPISNFEDGRLVRGIACQMRMPAYRRSMAGVREFLGYSGDPNSAGERFEKYCRGGGAMWWLLDGDKHVVALGPGLFCCDLGDLIPKEALSGDGACEAVAAVLSHQLGMFMDGRKIYALFDECRFYVRWLHRLIEEFTLTGRKKELMCGLLFQQPEHATESEIGMALVAQMRKKIIFPDAGYNVDNLRKIGLTDPAIRQVTREMTRGNGRRFLLWDDEPAICEFDLTGLPELPILAGRVTTTGIWDEMLEKGIDTDGYLQRISTKEPV